MGVNIITLFSSETPRISTIINSKLKKYPKIWVGFIETTANILVKVLWKQLGIIPTYIVQNTVCFNAMPFLAIYFLCYTLTDCKSNSNATTLIKDTTTLPNGRKTFSRAKIKSIKITFGIVIGKYWLTKLILLYI